MVRQKACVWVCGTGGAAGVRMGGEGQAACCAVL